MDHCVNGFLTPGAWGVPLCLCCTAATLDFLVAPGVTEPAGLATASTVATAATRQRSVAALQHNHRAVGVL